MTLTRTATLILVLAVSAAFAVDRIKGEQAAKSDGLALTLGEGGGNNDNVDRIKGEQAGEIKAGDDLARTLGGGGNDDNVDQIKEEQAGEIKAGDGLARTLGEGGGNDDNVDQIKGEQADKIMAGDGLARTLGGGGGDNNDDNIEPPSSPPSRPSPSPSPPSPHPPSPPSPPGGKCTQVKLYEGPCVHVLCAASCMADMYQGGHCVGHGVMHRACYCFRCLAASSSTTSGDLLRH